MKFCALTTLNIQSKIKIQKMQKTSLHMHTGMDTMVPNGILRVLFVHAHDKSVDLQDDKLQHISHIQIAK